MGLNGSIVLGFLVELSLRIFLNLLLVILFVVFMALLMLLGFLMSSMLSVILLGKVLNWLFREASSLVDFLTSGGIRNCAIIVVKETIDWV